MEKLRHAESLMPVILGSTHRVADYAYPNFGLTYKNEEPANQAYRAEWGSGTPAQVDLVSQALQEAGFTDFNHTLQETTAKAVSGIVSLDRLKRSYTIADIGAGSGYSALAIIRSLPPEVRRRTTILLIEPSEQSLWAAAHLIQAQGISYEKLLGMDSEVLNKMEPSSVDILTGVASIHHHARIPFDLYAQVLKEGGFAVFADWHQDLWEHPARVLRFLESFDWPQRQQGIDNWITTYPQALDDPDVNLNLTPAELTARKQITEFWLGYQRIAARANLGPNAIWPLEGHRPVIQYIHSMEQAGLCTDTPKIQSLIARGIVPHNPQQLLENSSLLQVSIGQKLTA